MPDPPVTFQPPRVGRRPARKAASFLWRSMFLGVAATTIATALVSMRIVGVAARQLVFVFGPSVRRLVSLNIARSIGPFIPLYALTGAWRTVRSSQLSLTVWALVGVALLIVYAVGLRRESWIARFEPEFLPKSRQPLGYTPSRSEDLRLHFLTRTLLAYAVPLAFVLATQQIGLDPSAFLALGFAAVYVGLGFQDYEICIHWDMHARVLDGTSRAASLAAPIARAGMDFLAGPLFGYVPAVYELNHLLVHHRANAGDGDPHSTLPYRRSSFLEFCAFATTVSSSLAFLLPFGNGRVTRRAAWLAAIKIVSTWAVVAVLVYHGNLLGIIVLWAIVRHGILVAADQIMWHGLVDPAQMKQPAARTTLGVSSSAYLDGLEHGTPRFHVPGPDEAWPFFDNLHLIHHLNSRIHFSQYEAELARRLPQLRRDGCIMMTWRRMDSFIFDCWRLRFSDLGSDLVTETHGEESATFIERHLEPVPALRSGFSVVTEQRAVRRLDAILGRGVASLVRSGYS